MNIRIFNIALLLSVILISCAEEQQPQVLIDEGSIVVLLGNNLCSRMMNFGHFETEVYSKFPDSKLVIRNICDGGNTPGFRQHSGRYSPWAFPSAESYYDDLTQHSDSKGHFESPDEWITRLQADIILAFFGNNEIYRGASGIENFKEELRSFVLHTTAQRYNGDTIPQLVLVGPTAREDRSDDFDLSDGQKENELLKQYSDAVGEVAQLEGIPFVDLYTPTSKWFKSSDIMTIDGFQLNESAYKKVAAYLVNEIFGSQKGKRNVDKNFVQDAVLEKNWYWHNDFKMPNGVHVFGRRYNPFGPDNYPAEISKLRELTAIRDSAIWLACEGKKMDLTKADEMTLSLPPVETNFEPGDYGRGTGEYLYGEDALNSFHLPEGYKIELFASEREFPDLANPVQLSFDDQGRLWVATMPSYPHWKPGDPKPDDKLIILEDTDNDGKADHQITFADGLHLPVGFEIASEGVYVSQGTNLKLLIDSDQDDHADKEEIVLSGFDDHDTHHNASAFCADPSGAIYMAEGVFLHTSVETAHGPVRATNGGFYRYNPNRRRLERTAQLSIPNPWGIAFDKWGQNFFLETSGPDMRWMMPGSIKPRYGVATHKSYNLIEDEYKVRPTSGLEFISSRHFPDEVQGDFVLGNAIGFLGLKQHQIQDDETGYESKFRQDLLRSDDMNFRPVDLEVAPDGSIYVVDWHNVLVGHMQHNARDPYRDHVHGRIYRITYPARPLVTPAVIDGADIETLLDNLKLPEYRSRYRSRRALRGHSADEVNKGLKVWVSNLDPNDEAYAHHLLEALWVSWGSGTIDEEILESVLQLADYRARAAGVRAVRYMSHQLEKTEDYLIAAASDPSGRVRLEAIVAASWLKKDLGLKVVQEGAKLPLDPWIEHAHATSMAYLNDSLPAIANPPRVTTHLKDRDAELFYAGKEIYEREGFCITCHQSHGQGLPASGFPPIAGTKWSLGEQDRMIKLTLKGMVGPIEVKGLKYPGQVPMTPYEGLMTDEEVAAVLTYVRNSFGNRASVVQPESVKRVREEIADKKGFYSPEVLEREHPFTDQ